MNATNKKSNLNVILIDDSESDIDVATEALRKFSYVKVKSFADSGQAYTFLHEEYVKNGTKNGLILLDLNMPGKNGFELLQTIKSNPALAQHPVLVYTSSERKEDIEKAYALGAGSYLIKPTDLGCIEKLFTDIVHYWTEVTRL